MTKRILDALFTALILVLAIPSTLILISWNAIPGDGLYPLKSGLENVVLLVFSGTPLVPQVSMKFTDQRLTEATKLLDKKGSTVGYNLLVANARQTQNYISEKNSVQAAAQFSKNIDNYQKEIAKKKIEVQAEIQSAPSSSANTTILATPSPTVMPSTGAGNSQTVIVNVPQTVVIVQENPQEVLQVLTQTEQQLATIQQEVNQNTHDGDSNGQGQGFTNNQNNNNNGNNQGNGGGHKKND